jgi:hypothetical protein
VLCKLHAPAGNPYLFVQAVRSLHYGRGGHLSHRVPGTIVTLMDTSNVENVFVAGKLMKCRKQAPN